MTTMTAPSIDPSTRAGLLLRVMGNLQKAHDYARRKTRGSGPLARNYDEAERTLRAALENDKQLNGRQLRCNAQSLVAKVCDELGAELTGWCPSAAEQWEYARLDVDGITLQIGASTGGVVSVNGDPFTPSDRVLNLTEEEVLKSIQFALAQEKKWQVH